MKMNAEINVDFPIRSLAHGNFRHSKNYHGLLPDSPIFDSEYAKKKYPVQLEQEEQFIGIYENKFGEKIFELPPETKIWDTILITNLALYLCNQGKREEKIYFKDIIDIKGPKDKIDDIVVHILLEDKVVDLVILYSSRPTGNPKDAFSWWNFLLYFEENNTRARMKRHHDSISENE